MFGRRFRFATVVAVAGATALLGACHPSLPIPRIEPVLANWTQPYTGNDKLRVHVFDTGTLTLPQAAAWAGGYWMSSERFDMLAFVIEHPEHGLVVFDTGLSPKIVDDSEAYMGKLLSWMSRPEMSEGMDLPSQMRAVGLDPAAVDTVVLSHLHFDHTGSLEEFPNATVVVAGAELAEARSDSWRNTYVLPGDFDGVTSWREIDFEDAEPVATFVAGIELFGDGSMHVVDLEGHTPGSMGLLLHTAPSPMLLTGDAAWVEQSWRYAARPIDAWDMRMWWEQIWRIKKMAQLVPDLVVVPGHDADVLTKVSAPAVILHTFEPADAG